MEHMVRFTGYIDEKRRPAGFPKEVYSDIFFDVKTAAELKNAIKSMYTVFVTQQCMLVPKDNDAIQEEESNFNYDSLILVPISMLTHIGTTTRVLAGEIPTIVNGHLQLLDGSKVWKQ
jgi:hypothetical protein